LHSSTANVLRTAASREAEVTRFATSIFPIVSRTEVDKTYEFKLYNDICPQVT